MKTRYSMGTANSIAYYSVPTLANGRGERGFRVEREIGPGTSGGEELAAQSMVSLWAQAMRMRRYLSERIAVLKDENRSLSERLCRHGRPAGMAGDSDQWRAVYEWIERVAAAEVPVLIRGERGTGKKSVARALHEGSRRRGKALIQVDCTLLPTMAAETGPDGKPVCGELMILAGSLKLAEGGTLLLEHFDRLPISAQARLLEVIQGDAFKPGASLEPVACDVRMIAATSEPLEEMVEAGRFDGGLFEAVCGEAVRLPALREVTGDILPLLDHFLESEAALQGKTIRRISPAVVDLLLAYAWPGNTGELRACVETAVAQCRDGVLRVHHFPSRLYAVMAPDSGKSGPLESAMAALEYDLVVEALALHHGNIAAAARYLGTTERVMGCRVKKFALNLQRFACADDPFSRTGKRSVQFSIL